VSGNEGGRVPMRVSPLRGVTTFLTISFTTRTWASLVKALDAGS
jgi:hypothetical protein